MGDRAPAHTETASDRGTFRRAPRLPAAGLILEALLWLIVAGSVLAIGSVHPWAYIPLWFACLTAGGLLAIRAAFADVDVRGRLLPRAPLLLPGLAFLLWVMVQLVPFPPSGKPLTLSVPDTSRGLAFVASLLMLHLVAAAVFDRREARERFRRFVAGLGLVLGLAALIQVASGAARIYGFFTPLERSGTIFGPFVNRNHFAGYMLMVVFTSFGLLARAWRRYRRRVGERPNPRRRLVALSTPEGTALLFTVIPATAAVAGLVASASRGGLVAFGAGLVLAGLGLRRRQGVPAWGLALAFAVMTLSWYGLERLGIRFNEAATDAPGRTAVWKDSLGRMRGHWMTGTGFNTFGLSMGHTKPWALPKGATPWPPEIETAVAMGERPGTRAVPDLASLGWYREAHNDYIQTLVETGVPGLLIALWAAAAAVRAVRGDPWLLAAVASVLLHVLVDFDLQIPAIPVLLVSLVAMRPDAPGAARVITRSTPA